MGEGAGAGREELPRIGEGGGITYFGDPCFGAACNLPAEEREILATPVALVASPAAPFSNS